MVAQELIAIDVALLLPEAVHARARLINEVLWKQRTDGFRFDQSHLPHITLVQQFVRRANLPALLQRIDSIVGATAALTLRVLAVGSHQSTAFFLLQRTPDLQRLHFVPHITLGIGTAPEPGEPFDFLANRTGLFHLGRFCTCRVLLKEWALETPS